MTRIVDTNGVVHFVNPAHSGHTLCCRTAGADLFGEFKPLGKETSDQVNCPNCAKVVCAIRNEPYNTLVAEVEDKTMMLGVYSAVEPDGPVRDREVP